MIELRNVVKTFGRQAVLTGISFTVRTGESKIILGVSGSGKSTILKLILGLGKPDSGEILIHGCDITKMKESELMEVRKEFGMIFQESALFDSMSVRENVGYRLYAQPHANSETVDAQVERLLEFVGLSDAIDKMPSELSGGMRRRVGLARALVGDPPPRVLLYDEPTAGLDPVTSHRIMELILSLRDIEGATGLLVTQDLKVAWFFANARIVAKPDGTREFMTVPPAPAPDLTYLLLSGGQIRFEGTQQELLTSKDAYVRDFIG
ncbi:MAG: ATP-binding cassette domain-containing protein [Acidobacteria bacterium]|nr:ATP-binding cassette domain-containing protein [Acidobacteriota bacterium]MBI3658127.1 ATP-binding cassette domain-containing protein [Acidobacteriota bacterium]